MTSTKTTKDIVLFETMDKQITLQVPVEGETVWLTQAQMAELFDTTKQNISLHIRNCFRENELEQESVVKEFFTTATDGKNYKTRFYNLDVIISVGYRVKSKRGVEFRKWANGVLKQYILKGYAANDTRLKQLGEVVRLLKRAEAYRRLYAGSFNNYDCGIAATGKGNDDQCSAELYGAIEKTYEPGGVKWRISSL